MNDIEQAAWNEAHAAEAAEEVQAESAEEAAIADPAAEAVEEAPEEVSEEAPAEEVTEEVEEAVEAAEDDFQDLLDPIPTRESLLAKHARIPNSAKDEMVSLAENWRAADEKLRSLGGEEGVEVLKPVLALVSDGDASSKSVTDAYGSLYKANPIAAIAMTLESAAYYISGENRPPAHRAVGDKILLDAFGVNADTIRDFVKLEQAGLINRDEDLKYIEGDGSYAQKIADERDALQRELADLKANPEKLVQKEQVEAVDELDADLSQRLDDGISKFLERGRWDKDSTLAQVAIKAVLADIKNDPEYKKAVKYVQSNGYSKDFVTQNTLQGLVNKAKTMTERMVREINGTFKVKTETSRNAEAKRKVEQTKPKSEILTQKKSIFDNAYTPTPDWEAEAWKESFAAGV